MSRKLSRPLIFGLYEQACTGNGSAAVSLWRHPADRRLQATRLEHWLDLAGRAESAGLDLLFFGDVLGVYDVYGGNADAAVAGGTELPALDPALVVPALAAVTEHLAFGVTVSTSYEHPFAHARRFSTLDHLTGGRIAWNIVTSYLPNAAANFGLDAPLEHAERYERAEEFLEVAYGLWEHSWTDAAFRGDREQGVFADPAGVRPIHHAGRWFTVAGPHPIQPSPQRTPVLVQAGWSPRGRAFAGRHAELVFVGSADSAEVRAGLEQIRRIAAAEGRDAAEIVALGAATIITGRSDAEVAAKLADYQRYYRAEPQLAAFAGWTGIDLAALGDEQPLPGPSGGAHSTLPRQTAGELRERFSRVEVYGGLEFVGTPDVVARRLVERAELSGVDGFLLHEYLTPDSLNDFARLVVPELRALGAYRTGSASGTLRSRIRLDGSSRLPLEHPARRGRRA